MCQKQLKMQSVKGERLAGLCCFPLLAAPETQQEKMQRLGPELQVSVVKTLSAGRKTRGSMCKADSNETEKVGLT